MVSALPHPSIRPAILTSLHPSIIRASHLPSWCLATLEQHATSTSSSDALTTTTTMTTTAYLLHQDAPRSESELHTYTPCRGQCLSWQQYPVNVIGTRSLPSRPHHPWLSIDNAVKIEACKGMCLHTIRAMARGTRGAARERILDISSGTRPGYQEIRFCQGRMSSNATGARQTTAARQHTWHAL